MGTNSLVLRVDEYNLVVLVDTVLVNPVRVEDTKVTASATNTLFSYGTKTTLELEVVNTLADGFTVGSTLGDGLFPVTAANTNTVDDISLLSLVAKTASLVGTRGAGGTVDNVELAVFPASDTNNLDRIKLSKMQEYIPHPEKETKHIRLLLLVELTDLFVCAHC